LDGDITGIVAWPEGTAITPAEISESIKEKLDPNTIYYITTYININTNELDDVYLSPSIVESKFIESVPVAFSTLPKIDKVTFGEKDAEFNTALVNAEFHQADEGAENVPITDVTIYYAEGPTGTIALKDEKGGKYVPPTDDPPTVGSGYGGVYPNDPPDETLVQLDPGADPPEYTDEGFTNALIPGLTPDETYEIVVVITNARGDKHALSRTYITADTTLNVTVPVKMIFAAFASDDGEIVSPEYSITVDAAFPVKVSLAAFNKENQDAEELDLISDVPTSEDELRLKFVDTEEDSPIMDWIASGTQADGDMGTLNLDDPSVSFKITGKYGGPFTDTAKTPKYAAVFKFEIVMP
jgi:hypothetical protein